MGGYFSRPTGKRPAPYKSDTEAQNAVLHRDLSAVPATVVATTEDNRFYLSLGLRVYDGSGGAAVSCLGHKFTHRIWAAVVRTIDYAATTTFTSDVAGRLCDRLIRSTEGILAKGIVYSSGSDAMEAAIKLTIQYHSAKGQPEREHFISREFSYHGSTLGALALSGHKARRRQFEGILNTENFHKISSCFEHLQHDDRTSVEQFVRGKAEELKMKIQEIGSGKVAAFVCEPIVGAALGCVPAVPGYLKAMQDVCHEYGVLFILDEIMCGMGRTGMTLHAFLKHPDVRPDVLVIGKGLAAGVQPIAAMLCSQAIVDTLSASHESFNHGHTFQNHPPACAAALEVLDIIDEFNLLENVENQGRYLKERMREVFEGLPNVSPPRGEGFFLGFSLFKDKVTKESFDSKLRVASAIHEKGWKYPKYGIYVYPGTGSATDGFSGDHIIVAPPFWSSKEDIDWLVGRLELLLKDYFEELNTGLTEK